MAPRNVCAAEPATVTVASPLTQPSKATSAVGASVTSVAPSASSSFVKA